MFVRQDVAKLVLAKPCLTGIISDNERYHKPKEITEKKLRVMLRNERVKNALAQPFLFQRVGLMQCYKERSNLSINTHDQTPQMRELPVPNCRNLVCTSAGVICHFM